MQLQITGNTTCPRRRSWSSQSKARLFRLPGRMASTLLCFGLAAAGFAGYWLDRPYTHVLASMAVSLSALSTKQKANIANAARRLDGLVLKPGQEFSFNGIVGPRTSSHGGLAAPSYVGNDSPATLGGGICLLSSAIYQDALRAGLQVTERVPHLRTTKSIAAGLDATVWYGMTDLRFRNTLDCPIQLVTTYTPNKVTVELRGNTQNRDWHPARITRLERRISPALLRVEVYSQQFTQERLVTRDIYAIPTTGEKHR